MKITKNIQTIARQTLAEEANAITKITEYIDEEFETVVNTILALKGRVIVTGIGKSAIIASKIVATLNSTGTPSVYMHAADAIHGDLGIIQGDDIVLCISKSGNTSEIKVLLPLIKRLGAKVIGMVSNMESYVAKHADLRLNATVEFEADPNNLAPTTSTTVQLALGDALAICLLQARGFTSGDFAKYHPGGSLGKQLYLTVDDLYPNNELPVIKKGTLIRPSIVIISEKRLGAAAIVDEEDHLIGIFTDGDLRRMFEKYHDFSNITIEEVMTSNPKTIEKGEYAIRALNLMKEYDISQLIVVDNKKVVGFLHINDLLNEGIV